MKQLSILEARLMRKTRPLVLAAVLLFRASATTLHTQKYTDLYNLQAKAETPQTLPGSDLSHRAAICLCLFGRVTLDPCCSHFFSLNVCKVQGV
jgi:hypothetical protein